MILRGIKEFFNIQLQKSGHCDVNTVLLCGTLTLTHFDIHGEQKKHANQTTDKTQKMLLENHLYCLVILMDA